MTNREDRKLIAPASSGGAGGLLVLLAAVCAILASVAWRLPAPPPKPVADLYHAQSGKHRSVIVEIDLQHQFPDGTTRKGLLLRESDGFETWFPFDQLPKGEIVMRSSRGPAPGDAPPTQAIPQR